MREDGRSACPINLALEVFGDRWSLLIIRDMIFAGKRHFREFLASDEKISTRVLSDRLAFVKLRDYKNGRPCGLGEGDFDNRGAVEALGRAGFAGWVVYEYDRAWFAPDAQNPQPDVDEVMRRSAMRLFEWIERGRGMSKRPDVERVGS